MLSDVEIDALYAQIERPFSQEEVARFVRTPESRARRLLEETHYHNYALIELTCSWKEFLAGTAPQPHEELGRLLTPGRNSENAARNSFEALAEFFSKYPHGGVPRFAIIPHALRSSFALIDHLDDLHPTADLTTAREQLRAFTCLVSYKGDPTLRRDAFAERLKDTSAAFLDACTRNAAELSLWISAMLKGGRAPPRGMCASRPRRRRTSRRRPKR